MLVSRQGRDGRSWYPSLSRRLYGRRGSSDDGESGRLAFSLERQQEKGPYMAGSHHTTKRTEKKPTEARAKTDVKQPEAHPPSPTRRSERDGDMKLLRRTERVANMQYKMTSCQGEGIGMG